MPYKVLREIAVDEQIDWCITLKKLLLITFFSAALCTSANSAFPNDWGTS